MSKKNYIVSRGDRNVDIDIDHAIQIAVVTQMGFVDGQEGALVEIKPIKGFYLSFETEPAQSPAGQGLLIRVMPRVRG